MNNKLKKTSLFLALAASTGAYAAGIPTLDAGSIATTINENVKTLKELRSQLDVLNQQIEQAKNFATETKNRFEGNWKLGDLISNDDFLSSLPNKASDELIGTSKQGLDSLRRKYGLQSENASAQAYYDAMIKKSERYNEAYKNTLDRINNLKSIQELSNNAITPAQKADVSNKLALEQLKFNQENAAIERLEKATAQQNSVAAQKENAEFQTKLDQAANDYLKRNSTN